MWRNSLRIFQYRFNTSLSCVTVLQVATARCVSPMRFHKAPVPVFGLSHGYPLDMRSMVKHRLRSFLRLSHSNSIGPQQELASGGLSCWRDVSISNLPSCVPWRWPRSSSSPDPGASGAQYHSGLSRPESL